VAAEQVGHRGRVIASDILPMDSIAGVDFVLGDFTENSVYERICSEIGANGADIVISDMAPNMSGMAAVDQPRAIYLAELALQLAIAVVRPGGDFVAKVFHGEGFESLIGDARGAFDRVFTRKPAASRPRSREVYLLARGLRAQPGDSAAGPR
jgi:23S rRNA (uridine2552-2'-O)-methyltransferase